jgi:hypothetical protein
MVKRTLLVLGILSLIVMVAGTSFAQFGQGRMTGALEVAQMGGGFGQTYFTGAHCWTPGDLGGGRPTYAPADCPPYPGHKTIIKKWAIKIEGPAPRPTPGVAVVGGSRDSVVGTGLVGGLVAAIPTPFDFLFGGTDGVYGCGAGLQFADQECGPCYGPLSGAVAAVPMALAAPTTIFGALW